MGIFGNGSIQNSPIIAIDEFTADGTWYCCPDMNCAQVITVGGGGGGGGGVVNLSLYHVAGGAGGGAGGVKVRSFEAWRLAATECVIIGQGGAGGASSTNCAQDPGNPGADGGDTCFGSLQVSFGGEGGAGGYSDGIDIVRTGGLGGGSSIQGKSFPNAAGASTNVGCLSENGEEWISSPGGGGAGWSVNLDIPESYVAESYGGAGSEFYGIELGEGGAGGGFSTPGYVGNGYGAGGGGGAADYNSGTCGHAGGDGYQGIAKIIQYCGVEFPQPPEPCAQTFTESGTWACCTGAIYIEVIALGAGGHGGVGNNTPTERFAGSAGGAGGGGGGYSFCTLLSFGATECVIVGYESDTCFGSSVVAYRGQNGGNGFYSVSFDASMSGGAGGTGSTLNGAAGGGSNYSSTVLYACNGSNSSAGGGGGAAGQGKYTCQFGLLASNIASGGLGASPYGLTGGTGGNATTTAGQPGGLYGAGGAGGSVPGQLGGTGAPGIIKIIQHFYVPI